MLKASEAFYSSKQRKEEIVPSSYYRLSQQVWYILSNFFKAWKCQFLSNVFQFFSNISQFLSNIFQFLSNISHLLSNISQFISNIFQFFNNISQFLNNFGIRLEIFASYVFNFSWVQNILAYSKLVGIP